MKRLNDSTCTKGDEPATCRDRTCSEANLGAKSEFSKKKPLPSIAIEKDPEFKDSVLCAATIHIKHKPRELACPKAHCPGQIQTPRVARDGQRLVPGRRSPPIPPAPTQGPCGDFPQTSRTRATLDGWTHRREAQSHLNPPWRATCAVVEPTQAGSICFERLPRGLKQLKPVDLCYRHGHRRLGSLEESQNVEGMPRRGRAAGQQRASCLKQRGDSRKTRDLSSTTFEEGSREFGNGPIADYTPANKTHRDGSLQESVDSLQPNDGLEIEATDPSFTTQIDSENGKVIFRCGADNATNDEKVETPHRETSDDPCRIAEDVPGKISEDTDLALGLSPKSAVTKAESLVSCRTVTRFHTDERPNSFTALTSAERRQQKAAPGEESQRHQQEAETLGRLAASEHRSDQDECTNFGGTVNEQQTARVREADNACNEVKTSPRQSNSSQDNKTTDQELLSGTPVVDAQSDEELSIASDGQQSGIQSSHSQDDEQSPVSSPKETQEVILGDSCEAELQTLSLYIPRNQDNETSETDERKTLDNQSKDEAESKNVLPEKPAVQEGDIKIADDDCPDLKRSLSGYDIAIGLRCFKTPENDTNEPMVESSPGDAVSPRQKQDGRNTTKTSTERLENERFNIRKIFTEDSQGKCKYLVLPDHVLDFHDDQLIGESRFPKTLAKLSDTSLASRETSDKALADPGAQREECDTLSQKRTTDTSFDLYVKQQDKDLEVDEFNQSENIGQNKLSNLDMLRTGTNGRDGSKKNDELADGPTENPTDEQQLEEKGGSKSDQAANNRVIESAVDELDHFPRHTHGSNMQGDWSCGPDHIKRPANYVEPNLKLEEMSKQFFTDTTPLDVAFNAINVINSCSNSISYHSCKNQKRLLAMLDDIKLEDVYKHALVCALAKQCAEVSREFSQSLHEVFQKYSSRARGAQEALIEYCRILSTEEDFSPELLRQIEMDGEKLCMVKEGNQYITKFVEDPTEQAGERNAASIDAREASPDTASETTIQI